jgi:hypothetical protein
LAATIKDINEEVTATTNEEKANYVLRKSKEGPVLVYCEQPLIEALIKVGMAPVKVSIDSVPEAVFMRSGLDKINEQG